MCAFIDPSSGPCYEPVPNGQRHCEAHKPERQRRDARSSAAPTFATSHGDEPNVVTDAEAGYGPADRPEVPSWAQPGDPYLNGVAAPDKPDRQRQPWYDRLGP